MKHDFSKQVPLELPVASVVSLCPICRGQGFTGCDEAILPMDHPIYPNGTLISLTLRKGVACSCAAGQEFAMWQMESFRPAGVQSRIRFDATRDSELSNVVLA